MSSVPHLYRMLVRVVRLSGPVLALGESKLARGVRGRREALETLEAWSREERDPRRPVVWFHAPSVGESLQAGAVIGALEGRRPEVQVAFTHFSPSAEGIGDSLGVDVSTYLPWDVSEEAARALDAVRPELLVFTKTEVWPVLVDQAARRGIPVAIVGAVAREGAGRMRWPARAALRGTWSRLALACANTEEDAKRLVTMGVKPSAVRVTGDPSVDSAAVRVARADPSAPSLAPFHVADRPVLVAGSTWPADEDVLLRAWQAVQRVRPEALLVVAPHEPTPGHTAGLSERVEGLGLSVETIGTVEGTKSVDGTDVVIVDRTGVLATLYRVATVAYVGGGFGRGGLHSVLEPAAAGVPTLFGPRHQHARAAGALLELGGARTVTDPTTLARAVLTWLSDPAEKRRAVRSASGYIGAHRGAAERTAELLVHLIEQKELE